jgi:hypothetical protein
MDVPNVKTPEPQGVTKNHPTLKIIIHISYIFDVCMPNVKHSTTIVLQYYRYSTRN